MKAAIYLVHIFVGNIIIMLMCVDQWMTYTCHTNQFIIIRTLSLIIFLPVPCLYICWLSGPHNAPAWSEYNRDGTRGVYYWKLHPLLFAGLSLPQTKIRSKHSGWVVWAQNKCHQKPLYIDSLFYQYLNVNFLFLGVIYLIGVIGGQLATSRGW